ncbi:MAG: hypothetical protein KC546_01110 [Anaerolineae bacterium]|nr:hypothetical protein [Anaerolineae bacterium]
MTQLRRYSLTIAVVSAAGMLFEITLTRLLSALYAPPVVFGVLSFAILGIGLGAGLATAFTALRNAKNVPIYIVLAGLSALFVGVASVWTASAEVDLLLAGSVLTLPYIFVGLSFSTLFSEHSEQSRILYAADLIGAGVATVLVIPLLDAMGAINGILFCVLLFMLAAVAFQPKGIGLIGILFAAIAWSGNLAANWLAADMASLSSQFKTITEPLVEGRILETRWDSFARTDLVEPADGSWRIYVDGAAASIIPPATDNEHLIQDIGLFAFVTAQPQSVFTIGSGGGLDVWFALQAGAESITAVEVNPQSVALTIDYADYSDDIYNQPGVRVIVDEGRSVLRREAATYDLIYLAQVVTLTAERAGYAMTENAVFTLEAFEEYLSHLNPDGYLGIKVYDEITMSRTLSLVIAALKNQQDLSDIQALDHVIALLAPNTSPPTPLLLVKRSPFTHDEVVAIGRTAQRIGFATLFLPGIQADPPLDAVVSGVNTYDDVVDISPADLSPPTDDRPFFYQFERGLPQDMRHLSAVLAVITVGLLALLIIYQWLARLPKLAVNAIYFAALGAGFMMVEVSLIQKMRLFIGHPTLSVTLVIATLLIGGGLGSVLYRRRVPSLQHLSWKPVLIVAVMLIVWLVIWQMLSAALIGAAPIIRSIAAAVALLPVGLAMGVPFAAGLTTAGQVDQRLVALAWGINGVFSVIGSVAGLALALTFGFGVVFFAAIVLYAIAALMARLL